MARLENVYKKCSSFLALCRPLITVPLRHYVFLKGNGLVSIKIFSTLAVMSSVA